ncbi:MAG: hypothetical protein KAG34_02445 [Cocleimonas sp.]|nr:hypothetical protein [Cocleimonas sp.]
MKKFKNNLALTVLRSLFYTAILLVSSISNAQQLNQVRAYIAPADPQKSYFPSKQQVQEALVPHAPNVEQESEFPPLEQHPQAFVNQFSTPDAPRAIPQFVSPDLIMDNTTALNGISYRPQAMTFPAAPHLMGKANNNFLAQGFDNSTMRKLFLNNVKSDFNDNPSPFTNGFPAVPFGHNKSLNSITDWNKWNGMENDFPLLPKSTPPNRNKAWGDVYTDFADKSWGESLDAPHNLGRMPEGWRLPYISTPDTVSGRITNQFPPIAEETGHLGKLSKWDIFDRD